MQYSNTSAKKVSVKALAVIAVAAALWSSHAGARNLIREPAKDHGASTNATVQPAPDCAATAGAERLAYRKLPHVVPNAGKLDGVESECVALAATDNQEAALEHDSDESKRTTVVFRNDRNNAHAHL